MRSLSIAALALTLAIAGRASADDPAPTFNKDVAPILFQSCSSCHRPDEVGPFSLLTYEDARKRAKQIARVTDKKIMPPWKPVAGHDVFKDARTLTDEQIGVFKAWVEAGSPEGEAKDLPPQPKFPEGWHAGEPDMILKVEKPFTIPSEGPDIYVHFVLPLNFDKDKYVKAVQILPTNRKVAHHGVIILDGSGTARKLAKKHGGDHYPNFGGPGFLPRGFLPGYAPGQTTKLEKSDKVSIPVGKGTDIVLQMHYHPIGKEVTDQPQIGLYFTDKKPERNINIVGMANNDVYIPAGENDFKRTDSFTLPVDFEVGNIWGHMHMIGREMKVWAELPDGKQKDMLLISDWDFNWQDTYHYQKSFVLPKGTVVKAEWTWVNTADNPRNPNSPPKLIQWGEGSTDEMSGLIIGGITVDPKDEGPMWIPVILHYLEIERKAVEAAEKRKAIEAKEQPEKEATEGENRAAVTGSESADNNDLITLPKGWESRFNTGRQRPKYDPKTRVLTLVYDFSNQSQLKDFEASAEAKPEVSKGVLALKGTESVKHIAEFKTMHVSVAFVTGKGDSKVMTTTGGFGLGTRDFFGEYLDLYIGDRRCAEYRAEGNLKFIKAPVTVEWTIDGAKTGVISGSADIRAKSEGQDAGQLVLQADTHPNYYQALTISGVVDPKWIKTFFVK